MTITQIFYSITETLKKNSTGEKSMKINQKLSLYTVWSVLWGIKGFGKSMVMHKSEI